MFHDVRQHQLRPDCLKKLKENEKHGTGLLVTDQFSDNQDIFQISPKQIDDVHGNFDYIIINLNKSLINKHEADMVKIILNAILKIKNGGYIFVPKNTYQLLPSGRKGIEALIKVLNYNIELPPYYIRDIVIASKGT